MKTRNLAHLGAVCVSVCFSIAVATTTWSTASKWFWTGVVVFWLVWAMIGINETPWEDGS
jgi:hypothetical protein